MFMAKRITRCARAGATVGAGTFEPIHPVRSATSVRALTGNAADISVLPSGHLAICIDHKVALGRVAAHPVAVLVLGHVRCRRVARSVRCVSSLSLSQPIKSRAIVASFIFFLPLSRHDGCRWRKWSVSLTARSLKETFWRGAACKTHQR
jgi:hypothetical protein